MMKKHEKLCPILLTLCTLLVFAAAVVGVRAKYVKEQTFDGDVTIEATLGNIALKESKAILQPDGSYVLDTGNVVLSNDYECVIPGLDIPKDARVEITDKTAIPAHIYLTVHLGTQDSVNKNLIKQGTAGISYELAAHWKWDAEKHAYFYANTLTGTPIEVTTNVTIQVLKDNTVYVSDALSLPGPENIVWSVRMEQVATTP